MALEVTEVHANVAEIAHEFGADRAERLGATTLDPQEFQRIGDAGL